MNILSTRPAWLTDLACVLATAVVVVLFAILVLSLDNGNGVAPRHVRTGVRGPVGVVRHR